MPVIAVAIAGEDGDKLRRLTEDSVKEQTYSRWIISKSPRRTSSTLSVYVAGRYSPPGRAVYLRKKYRGQ